ncbi:DUF1629 domain-containing protein [Sphingomonas sp. ST-64]|uniref:DUF1629 domain-containing protein n=1 Tax=Sphingomonas plantiphila TaxID=3163295 RepID=A0ABW8YMP5_9SPHN
MAYGLNIQPVYGKYPKVESLDDRFKKIGSLKDEFRHLLPTKADGTPDFSSKRMPILPNSMLWRDRAGRAAPDFDVSPWLNVSATAKAIIERWEPGVHEFAPVAYTYSRGATETRFWVNVGNRIDAVAGGPSNMALLKRQWRLPRDLLRNNEPMPDGLDPDAPSKLVFRSEAVRPYHMWADCYLGRATVFISDALADCFLAEGVTGLALANAKVEEI